MYVTKADDENNDEQPMKKPARKTRARASSAKGATVTKSQPAVPKKNAKRPSSASGVQETEPKVPKTGKAKAGPKPAVKTAAKSKVKPTGTKTPKTQKATEASDQAGGEGEPTVPAPAVTRVRKPRVSQEPLEPVLKLPDKKPRVESDVPAAGHHAPAPVTTPEPVGGLPSPVQPDESQSQRTTWYLGCKYAIYLLCAFDFNLTVTCVGLCVCLALEIFESLRSCGTLQAGLELLKAQCPSKPKDVDSISEATTLPSLGQYVWLQLHLGNFICHGIWFNTCANFTPISWYGSMCQLHTNSSIHDGSPL